MRRSHYHSIVAGGLLVGSLGAARRDRGPLDGNRVGADADHEDGARVALRGSLRGSLHGQRHILFGLCLLELHQRQQLGRMQLFCDRSKIGLLALPLRGRLGGSGCGRRRTGATTDR